ncbi:MAG: hypothetical protein K6D98_02485 [Clostridiales bacterium]|nr:hypothetical protein [Clostridiales bacterium]
MTANLGTEYINEKEAQYNRNMRNARAQSALGSARANEGAISGSLADDLLTTLGREIARARSEKKRAKQNETVYRLKKVKSAKAFPVSIIGYIAVFTIIAGFLVLGNSRINEATLYADSLKSEISAQNDRAEVLNAALGKKNDAKYIEDYAVNVLGMVKSADVSRQYISISGEEKTVVSNKKTESQSVSNATLTLNATEIKS